MLGHSYKERKMKKKAIILFTLFLIGFTAMGADLPSKGLETPVSVVKAPGSDPGDPLPIGGGLFILLGMSATYLLVKKKKSQ